MDLRRIFGDQGERMACRHLKKQGYRILERNLRTRLGEIDVVAEEGGTLVFVEVKRRKGDSFGGPGEAVTEAKQRKLSLVAVEYLARHGKTDTPARFDVVAITDTEDGPRIEIFRNAFDSSIA